MTDDDDAIGALSKFGVEWLDPEKDYQWSGWLVQRKVRKPSRRVVAGTYDHWFRWYMRFQRFRAFHTIILIDPSTPVADHEHGGYIDGLLARLMGKVRQVVIVSRSTTALPVASDEGRAKQVLRAILYGTRLSKPALIDEARQTFITITEQTVVKTLAELELRLNAEHTRYQLDDYNSRLLEGMVPVSEEGDSGHVEQVFHREERFRTEDHFPDEMLAHRAVEDVAKHGWVGVPFEADKLRDWLNELNKHGDRRIRDMYEANEGISNEQWEAILAPRRNQVRRVLSQLALEGQLERRAWYREVGRPAQAYIIPGRAPFLEQRCGQCAFYAPAKRRCRLWWLANKKHPFFDQEWRQPGSAVTRFEIHKMRYASKMGPHSSACLRFLDKKRDHLRRKVPERCEICHNQIPSKGPPKCGNCGTWYAPLGSRVKVLTAYEHDYNRLYKEITGGDAKTDLESWRAQVKERLQDRDQVMGFTEDFEDALAEEGQEPQPEPWRARPEFRPELQAKVDNLIRTSDLPRRLSIAMAQSALTATRRLIEFGKVYAGDADPLVTRQGRYLALVREASSNKLLPYEALVMKQYWLAFGYALRGVQEWVGPRKRSRFVAEYAEAPAARARGYSPIDAAINYLHQRRLRQAERVNIEVGFPGTCDGFLHREAYRSRKIGLLLDMIDPFKFADREELLLVVLNKGLTWRDFKIETDRRGSNFYYPNPQGEAKLWQAGSDADGLIVHYQGIDLRLAEAYTKSAASLLHTLDDQDSTRRFEAFEYAPVRE